MIPTHHPSRSMIQLTSKVTTNPYPAKILQEKNPKLHLAQTKAQIWIIRKKGKSIWKKLWSRESL